MLNKKNIISITLQVFCIIAQGNLLGKKSMITGRPDANAAGTHIAALITAVLNTTGPIIEFGCGDWSTPLLHAVCKTQNRFLLSAETDQEWINNFLDMECDMHKFVYVPVWKPGKTHCDIEEWDHVGNGEHWGLIFIDHGPIAQRRRIDIARLRGHADVFVVHDTEAPGYLLDPILNSFKYKYVDLRYRTTTTVVSDTIDVQRWFE